MTDGPSDSTGSISTARSSSRGAARPAKPLTRSSASKGRLRSRAVTSGVAGPTTASLVATLYPRSCPSQMASRSSGLPNGERASNLRALGRRASSAPASCWRAPRRLTVTAASVRRSLNARQLASRRSTARRASGESGSRGVGRAVAQPDTTTATRARLLRSLRALTLHAAKAGLHGLDLGADPVGVGIELERALPRGQGVLVETALGVGIAQVLEDHRIVLGPLHGALQLAQRIGVAPLLEVGPAQAVDEVPVLGLDLEGLGDELHGLVEVLAALGIHVAHVVIGLGMARIGRDDLAELLYRVVELRLLLVDHPQLEVEVLAGRVERESLLEGFGGPVVLLGAEVRGTQIEEQLGPLGLEVDGFTQDGDGLVVALGPAVQEAQLHAGVDRARIGAQDALQLGARLGVLAPVHVGRGQEVARPHVGGIGADGAAEGVAGAVPHLLLVVHDAELQPDRCVAGRSLRQFLDALLRFGKAAHSEEEVPQTFHEGRIVGIVAQRLLVHADG